MSDTLTAPAETVTKSWVMPDTDWPQAVFSPDAISCGTTVRLQVDTYWYSTPEQKAIVDALDDDGFLTLVNGVPEDSAVYKSHYYDTYTAPACEPTIPEQPEDEVASSISLPAIDCDANTVSVTTTTSTTPYIWDGKQFVPGETTTSSSVSVIGTPTAEECPPVTVTPGTPGGTDTTGSSTTATVSTLPTDLLAETGPGDWIAPLVIGAVLLAAGCGMKFRRGARA